MEFWGVKFFPIAINYIGSDSQDVVIQTFWYRLIFYGKH